MTEIRPKVHGHVSSWLEKKSPPIDITRKWAKFWHVSFNPNFDHDDVIQMRHEVYKILRELFELYHIKIWEKMGEGITEIHLIEYKKTFRNLKNPLFWL